MIFANNLTHDDIDRCRTLDCGLRSPRCNQWSRSALLPPGDYRQLRQSHCIISYFLPRCDSSPFQAYCFWGQSSVFTPYYGVAFVSEFLGTNGAKVAMLDDGASAIGVYAVFSSSNAPVRLLVINTNYFDGSGTRSSTSVALTGLVTSSGTKQVKRMTAPAATSRVDQGAAVTIGGVSSFNSDCSRAGTQSFESVAVSGNAMTVSVKASEAVIVFL